MAGWFQRTSDRQALPFGKSSKKREHRPIHGSDFSKGAARMSRTRLSQPQGARRRNGRTTAATARRFCSKVDVVRNSVDLLGRRGR